VAAVRKYDREDREDGNFQMAVPLLMKDERGHVSDIEAEAENVPLTKNLNLMPRGMRGEEEASAFHFH